MPTRFSGMLTVVANWYPQRKRRKISSTNKKIQPKNLDKKIMKRIETMYPLKKLGKEACENTPVTSKQKVVRADITQYTL